MAPVFLFDIDNTLLYSGGAGSHAMNMAFHELFGVSDGFARVEFSGRTDRYILHEALRGHGIEGGWERYLEEFTSRYYALLPAALRERQGRLMPGFPPLLEALSHEAGVRLGLATGNFSEAARLKLEHYGLAQYFKGGGFGEESLERSGVVRSAIKRAAGGARPAEVFVIGDTPHDVSSALENGVVAVGVATGNYTAAELRQAGAHLVFADFADWQAAAKTLLGR
ncbi:MAG: HAD family hydrolase [Dehalococcoidia bacterium]|nr:HAD family hydrolase [Dehalococcoidia bacterium]